MANLQITIKNGKQVRTYKDVKIGDVLDFGSGNKIRFRGFENCFAGKDIGYCSHVGDCKSIPLSGKIKIGEEVFHPSIKETDTDTYRLVFVSREDY